MKKSVDDQEPPSPEQSQNRNIEDIKHEPPETSTNTKKLDDVQPGGSKPEKVSKKPIQRSSVSIFSANKETEYFHLASTDTVVKNNKKKKEKKNMKSESAGTNERTAVSPNPSITTVHSLDCQLTEDIEYSHLASTDTLVKNKETLKSESAGTSKERTAVSPILNITTVHSLENHLTEEKPPENEDSDITSLREMFPDLKLSDENLSLKRLQQMSTTDITKEIVSLNKPAVLKPTVRLIPQNKTWLSPLEEVDKHQEAEAEKEIVQWERQASNQETDSESDEETELTIDLEDDGSAKE